MAHVIFKDVSVDFPVYNASSRSIKKDVLKIATGGKINPNPDGKVVVKALDGVSFRLEEGDRVGLLGHNGAGKTTLLRLLSGAYHPTQGIAEVSGKIGSLIAISLGMDPESTGRENIYIRGALLGLKRKEVDKFINSIIDFSELGDFVDMPVRTYSSGMHLRLAFSASTIFRPEILLMDEWLSVGDESFKHKAEERLNDIINTTKILVIASHSETLIRKTCNKAIWMEHGRKVMEGAAGDVCSEYFKS